MTSIYAIPEKRCTVCGALFNVERCRETTHSAHNGRQAERREIVARIRQEASTKSAVFDAERRCLHEIADILEREGAL